MGARINFIFDDGTDALVGLYSHWGADSWQEDLSAALEHARPRKGDYSYFTRMIISHLMKDEILDETGFGIFGLTRDEIGQDFDQTVVIDLTNNVVLDDSQNVIPFYGEMVVQ